MQVSTGAQMEVSNNLISLDGGAATNPTLYGWRDQSVTGGFFNFYFNDIYISGPATSNSTTCAMNRRGVTSFYTMYNNLIVNMRAAGGTGKHYAMYVNDTTCSGYSDNNDIYSLAGPFGNYKGADLSTYASYLAATGLDINSQNVDPNFVSTSDLRTSRVELNNQGVSVPAVTTDFRNNVRTNPPDMGAYEFTVPIASIHTLAATAIGSSAATLSGDINTSGEVVGVSFEYGTSLSYGNLANALPSPVRSFTGASFSATLPGLAAGTLYHYRAKGVSTTSGETIYGADMTFTTLAVPANTTVENVTIANGADTCFNATNTITIAGNGTTFVVQNGGSATMIAGQNIRYLPGTMVEAGGYMHGYITLTNEYCGSIPPPAVAVKTVMEENSAVSLNPAFRVYPNPTSGNFTLVRKGDISFGNVHVEVYNMNGAKVMTEPVTGAKQELPFAGMPGGIYFVKVIADGYVETIKLVKL